MEFTINCFEAISKILITGDRDDAGYFALPDDIRDALDEHQDIKSMGYTVGYADNSGTKPEVCDITGRTCMCDTLTYKRIQGRFNKS